MQPSPFVSAIVPTRNRPALVMRAVHSALQQTFRDLEVIVVIDGPDSESFNALDQIDDFRLRVLALEDSVGGSEARNIGARAARGQWIALLDDDDEWLPNKIAVQVTAAKAYRSDRILVTSTFLQRSPGKADILRPRRLPRKHEAICDYMFDFLCYFQTSTFFCSRRLLLDVPFQKNLRSFQDIDWFLRSITAPGVELVVVPEPLSIYNAPQDRKTITSQTGWRDRLNWGKQNRALITRKGYARFVAGSCAGRAVQDECGFRGFLELFHECVFVGSPEIATVILLFATFMVTPRFRRHIRDIYLKLSHGLRLDVQKTE